jgi:hypothetical protein
METSITGSPASVVSAYPAQATVQPQEQQSRTLQTERERETAAQVNDQVTLSSASTQNAANGNKQVVSQAEVSAAADKSQEKDRVEQVRQNQIETQRQQPVPLSVAQALATYAQTSVL